MRHTTHMMLGCFLLAVTGSCPFGDTPGALPGTTDTCADRGTLTGCTSSRTALDCCGSCAQFIGSVIHPDDFCQGQRGADSYLLRVLIFVCQYQKLQVTSKYHRSHLSRNSGSLLCVYMYDVATLLQQRTGFYTLHYSTNVKVRPC